MPARLTVVLAIGKAHRAALAVAEPDRAGSGTAGRARTGAKNDVVKICVTQPGHDLAAEGRALAPLMNAAAQALREP